jgi:transposase-like protein
VSFTKVAIQFSKKKINMAIKEGKLEESELQKRQGHYSISEKRQIVAKVEAGTLTAKDAAEQYGISTRTVYNWIDTHALNADLIPRTAKHSAAQRRQLALQIRQAC